MRRKSLLFAFLLTAVSTVFSQQQNLINTYIANGGQFGNPDENVSLGYFNQEFSTYQVFDSIDTQSVQDIIQDEDYLFVNAQDSLIAYDRYTHERTAAIAREGLSRLAVYEDYLLVSLQYPVTSETLLVYDKHTLDLETTIPLSGEAADIIVSYDSAYVAVPGSWGAENGTMAVVDLTEMSLAREMDLGHEARGIKELFLRSNKVYSVNTHFSDTEANTFSVTTYDIFNGTHETSVVEGDYYGYYGNSVMSDSIIYIPVSSSVSSYNVFSQEIDFDFLETVPAALAFDKHAGQIHLTHSDYATYGYYEIYNLDGDMVEDNIEVGVSPEAMTLEFEVVNEFTSEDVLFWTGEGDKEVVLVIDWNDGIEPQSMAWGFRFDGEATAETMLQTVAEADAYLDVSLAGGFLNDIMYNSTETNHEGIGGQPDWWSTWSRTDTTLWEMNMGISQALDDGDRFGCSYGFEPEATPPDTPEAAPYMPTSIEGETAQQNQIYISGESLVIKAQKPVQQLQVYDASGKLVSQKQNLNTTNAVIHNILPESRIIIVVVKTTEDTFSKKLIK